MKILLVILICMISLNLNALSLGEAIKLALKYNPVINKTAINIDIQKRKTKQIQATQFGKIDFLAMYNRYDANRVMQPLDMRHLSEDIISTGFQYEVPIFTGFELTENIKISKLLEKVNNLTTKLTKNQIIFNIKSVYLKILSLNKQVNAMYSYKKSLLQLYSNVKLMVDTGKKPEVDLYKIQYDVKSVDAIIERLTNGINTLKYALKELIGKKDLKITKIEDVNITTEFRPEKINFEEITSIKKINIKKEVANAKIKKEKSIYFPQLYLKANSFENFGHGDDVNIWQISLNLKYDIFDFGKRKNRIEEAELERKKIDFEKLEIQLKKEKDIKDAINKIKTEEANIESFKNQIKFAKESERIEKLKYQQGVSQIYDYLYAKSRRYIAESRFYNALYSREQAIAYYEYVIEKYAK